MRRKERHHLKENPLAILLAEFRGWLAESRRSVLVGGGIVLAVLVATGGYFSWTQVQQQRAGELLAEAMSTLEAAVVPPPADPVAITPEPDTPVAPATDDGTDTASDSDSDSDSDEDEDAAAGDDVEAMPDPEPTLASAADFVQPPGSYPTVEAKLEAALPQLLAVADAYPSTQQGVTARYQAAAVLVALERANDAVAHYQQVIDVAGDALYGQMSRMGLAEALLLTGQPQEAIPLLQSQTGSLESIIPVDAVLMRLGRAYLLAGQPDDALATFNRVVEEFPISMYYAEAQQEVETLRLDSGGLSSSD